MELTELKPWPGIERASRAGQRRVAGNRASDRSGSESPGRDRDRHRDQPAWRRRNFGLPARARNNGAADWCWTSVIPPL